MSDDDINHGGRRNGTESNPAIYLPRQPNDEERALIEALGLNSVSGVPPHMFVKLVMMVQELKELAARVLTGWRIIRWIGMPLIGAVIGNATCVGKAAYEAHDAHVSAEQQRVDDQHAFQVYRDGVEKEMAELRLDIRELRQMLRKISGADPGPVGSVQAYAESAAEIAKLDAP